MLRKDFIDMGFPPKQIPQFYDCTYEEVNDFQELCGKHMPYESGIWTSSLEWFWEQMIKYESPEEVVAILNTCLQKTIENVRYIPGRDAQSRYLYGTIKAQVQGLRSDNV